MSKKARTTKIRMNVLEKSDLKTRLKINTFFNALPYKGYSLNYLQPDPSVKSPGGKNLLTPHFHP
jgi:hypothetical protein